jgi:hypothetical protein
MHVARVLRLLPFTFAMLTALVGSAIWTRTHLGPLSTSSRRHVGFAPLHLPSGNWMRLFSSVFFTVGGSSFYTSAAMLAGAAGTAEIVYGTASTTLLFWGIHLATLLLLSVLFAIPLHALDFYRGTLVARAQDVGPSAGYYGCLGSVCSASPEVWRIAVTGVILVFLLARLVWSFVRTPDDGRAISADLSHIIAFPLGVLWASLMSSPASLAP